MKNLLMCFLVLLGFSSMVFGQERYDQEEVTEKKLAVKEGQLLTLKSDLGSISVKGTSDRQQVLVRVVKGANNIDEEEADELFNRFELTFDETNDGPVVTGDYDRPSWRRGRNLQVRYEIMVPRRFDLNLATAGGSISVELLEGEARVKTSGGSISAEKIDGLVIANTSGGSINVSDIGNSAELETSGGSIVAEGVRGDVNCHTSGGSITINSVDGDIIARTSGGGIHLDDVVGEVDASTSGGSINASMASVPQGPISLKTSGGSVNLDVPSNAAMDIDAVASGGRVSSELAISGTQNKERVRGEINGGGPTVTLRTSGGGIHIRKL